MKINQVTDARSLKLERGMLQEKPAVSFRDMLQKETENGKSIQFSKHASQRVRERGIVLNSSTLENLNSAVERARQKGARDVAVIGEKGAFIVNVPNNIVITTMTESEMRDNIFTNIDSAVLM